jgi:hypothetical protein
MVHAPSFQIAMDTNSLSIKLYAFPQQQWLCEHDSRLYNMYTAYLVLIEGFTSWIPKIMANKIKKIYGNIDECGPGQPLHSSQPTESCP